MQLGVWSTVSGRGPVLLNIAVHSLWEPLAVLSQQVCGKRQAGLERKACMVGRTATGPWFG